MFYGWKWVIKMMQDAVIFSSLDILATVENL